MTIELRPYQEQYVAELRRAFAAGNRSVCGVAATGAGKTVVSAFIAKSAMDMGNRVMFTVHRKELLEQTSRTFREFGIPHGFIIAGKPYDRSELVHIASVDTLRNHIESVALPNLLVADECHLSLSKTQVDIINRVKAARGKILGNTGSPLRLDGKPMADIFDCLVNGPSTGELIRSGFLSDYIYLAPPGADLSGIKKSRGDYAKGELAERCDTRTLLGDIVRHWKRHALGRRTICFAVSHAHADHICESFRASGITAERIGSDTPQPKRREMIGRFADGELSILANVELITTGFDLASQVGRDVTVEAIIMARPTMSLALCLQMWGRVLRRKPDPAIILDHAGNSLRHGWPDDEREWSLDGGERKSSEKAEVPPPVTCETCYRQSRRPLPPVCVHCGSPWPMSQRARDISEDNSVELQVVTKEEREKQREEAARDRRREESKCKSLEDLQELGKLRGYKDGWATHRWAARQGRSHA